MKKAIRWALCLCLCLALLVCVALAAEESAIHVQLDGQDLAFTDAVPQVKDQRTFLPFRAVFEAMGAEVSNEGEVITAVRDGKTLTMTLDQTAATVTEGDKTTPIVMDVAPYVDPATWRTYVPVRFAAQALGCAVGWDQNAQTAIVIDTDKLVSAATEGKSFTYLEKLAALSEKYNEGIWDMAASFDADVSVMAMPMSMTGTVQGTVQDNDKTSVDMNMRVDMSQFLALTSAMGGQSLSAEEQAMIDALKTDGVDLTMRGDMTTGKLYMNMDMGALAAEAGLDPSVWYELDMAQFMKLSGMDMDWTALMAQSKSVNYLDMVKAMLTAAEPTDAATAYTDVKAAVEDVVAAFSDQGFVQEDGQYVAGYVMENADSTATLSLGLDMEGETLKGYILDMDMAGQAAGQTMVMVMTITMDDQNSMTAEMYMGMGGLVTMHMTMEGGYTPGTTAPVVTPPEGAAVVDYMEMLTAQMGTVG